MKFHSCASNYSVLTWEDFNVVVCMHYNYYAVHDITLAILHGTVLHTVTYHTLLISIVSILIELYCYVTVTVLYDIMSNIILYY